MGLFSGKHEKREAMRHAIVVNWLTVHQTQLERIEMTQAELARKLEEQKIQAEKAHTEITTRLDQLLDAIRNNPVDPSVEQAAIALGASIQKLDDLHPDAPPTPAPASPS